jgi:hypothetical protein
MPNAGIHVSHVLKVPPHLAKDTSKTIADPVKSFQIGNPSFQFWKTLLLQFNLNLCLEQKVFGLSTKELMLHQFFQESMQMQ